MKFLFIYPASRRLELGPRKFLSTGAHLPPLGILYLGKILENNDYDIEVLDYNAQEISADILKEKVLSSDAVGMTLYSGPVSLESSMNLSKTIKECDPNIPLIIGGPHCCYYPEKALNNHHADICVQREGESVIIPLAEALEGKRKLSTVPGINFKENNEIKKTKPPDQIKNLDSLPFPARHLVDKYDYGFVSGVKLSKGRTTSILTSRGCSFNCRFCGLHYIVPGYRRRSFDNIIKEIDEIINAGYKTLVFVDDNFLQLKKEVEKIMDFIIQKNANLRIWIEQARVDSADRELYQKMRDAGVEVIEYGVESGNQDVLDYYNKRITLNQIRKAITLSKEMGFFVSASFILGAPIETKEHIENTKKFAKSLPLDDANFYNFLYMIGSPIWEEAVKEGKIKPEEYSAMPDPKRGLGNFTEQELIDYVNKVYKSYYFDPRLWIREVIYAISKKDLRFLRLGLKILTPS